MFSTSVGLDDSLGITSLALDVQFHYFNLRKEPSKETFAFSSERTGRCTDAAAAAAAVLPASERRIVHLTCCIVMATY